METKETKQIEQKAFLTIKVLIHNEFGGFRVSRAACKSHTLILPSYAPLTICLLLNRIHLKDLQCILQRVHIYFIIILFVHFAVKHLYSLNFLIALMIFPIYGPLGTLRSTDFTGSYKKKRQYSSKQ